MSSGLFLKFDADSIVSQWFVMELWWPLLLSALLSFTLGWHSMGIGMQRISNSRIRGVAVVVVVECNQIHTLGCEALRKVVIDVDGAIMKGF
jgi:hypothetical protein